MADRTLVVRYLKFRERGDVDGEVCPPSDLEGENLLDIFCEWCDSLDIESTSDANTNRFIRIDGYSREYDDFALIDLSVGTYGELGDLVRITDGNRIRSISEDEAPTGFIRIALMVPPTGIYALCFMEQGARGSGALRLLQLFCNDWNRRHADIYVDNKPVLERDAWLAGAQSIKQIEVRSFSRTSDAADNPLEDIAYYQHIVKPKKSRFFDFALFERLSRDPGYANKLVDVSYTGEIPDSKVIVKVRGADGRDINYTIGDFDDGTTMRRVLTSGREQPLQNDVFIEVCTELGGTILSQMQR